MSVTTAWKRRCRYIINKYYVNSTLTSFPIMITAANCPLDLFGGANSDGGDIRATSDAAGTAEIPVEIAYFSATNRKCEIHIKIGSISPTNITSFYLWYKNSAATMPAANSTYGSQNVWDSSFKFVWHLNNSLNDSTSNGLNAAWYNANGVYTTGATGIPNGGVYSTSSDYSLQRNLDTNSDFDQRDFTISGWMNGNGSYSGQILGSNSDPRILYGFGGAQILVTWGTDGQFGNKTIAGQMLTDTNNWHPTACTRKMSNTTVYLYTNGSLLNSKSEAVFGYATLTDLDWYFGDYGQSFIDEIRYSINTVRTDAWFKAEAACLQNTADFIRCEDQFPIITGTQM